MRSFALLSALLLTGHIAASMAAKCTGSPPTYNGLPCATTTRYWDDLEGACGCGSSSGPFSWSYTSYTAAASDMLFGHGSTWCGSGCGSCYELTPTGDCTDPSSGCLTGSTSPITIMITNLCPYSGNEEWCPESGSLNQWGYGQHFDLMDYNMAGAISALGWNNPIVTYRQVNCGSEGSPSCADAATCDCGQGGCNSVAGSATTGSGSTTTSGSATTATSSSATTASAASTSTSSKSSTTTGSASASTTGSQSSTTTGSAAAAGAGSSSATTCSISLTTSLNSWNGGGLVTMNIKNTGTKTISGVTVLVGNGSGITNYINLNSAGSNEYTLPSWAAITTGTTYSSSMVQYSGSTAPNFSVVSYSC